jgi:hypothetical protein
MRDYETLLEEQRGPYTVVVDKTWEDINPRDCFEAEDADEICRKIDNGTYDWFMLRVRVQFEGYELAAEYLGGCCYQRPEEVLTDGTAEDIIEQAIEGARKETLKLTGSLNKLVDTCAF